MLTFRQPFVGDYPITLDYGEKFLPLYTDESPHRGIDYGCPMGTEILASEDGTVQAVANLDAGYGKYIKLNHAEGYSSYYAHLSQNNVRQGQTVKKGQVIGLSGNSGNSTGPHLHFEIRKNGLQIDPKNVLQSVFDVTPINNTPNAETHEFDSVAAGAVIVCCDLANVRCHCDMNRVVRQLPKGTVIMITDVVTMYNGLPYRDYWDGNTGCWLRIAEHDPYDQIIRNFDLDLNVYAVPQ